MALRQTDIKRMLAYSTMGQVGAIVATLGLGTYLSLVAGLYHVLNHAIMKGMLFLAAGILILKLNTREISIWVPAILITLSSGKKQISWDLIFIV